MTWFPGSVVSDLNSVLKLKNSTKSLVIIIVSKEIRSCWLRYFSHLQRMDTYIWPRRVNDYVVPGSLSRGCPQLRWSDVITNDLKNLNIRKELAEEWVEWRKAIMPSKKQLQRVQPIRGGQALWLMGKVIRVKICVLVLLKINTKYTYLLKI